MGRGEKMFYRVCKVAALSIIILSLMVMALIYYHYHKSRDPCDIDLSVPLFNPKIHRNGTLEYGSQFYPPGYHFKVNETIRGCLCTLKPCIRKCCNKDEYKLVQGQTLQCKKNLGSSPFDNLTLPVYQSAHAGIFDSISSIFVSRQPDLEVVDVAGNHFNLLYGDPCGGRDNKYLLNAYQGLEYYLMVDGGISFAGQIKYASEYCMESVNRSAEISIVLCPKEGDPEDLENRIKYKLYPIGMVISIIFIVITFLVLYSLPNRHNSLYRVSFLCHLAALLPAYLFLTIIQIGSENLSHTLCAVFAFITQYSFLSSFLWMNVMSYDYRWLTYEKGWVDKMNKNIGNQGVSRKEFLFSSLYAWGIPSVIVAISVAMDTVPGIPDIYTKPNFGKERCWFANDKGKFLYFYLPLTAVMIFNVMLFVRIVKMLQKHKRKTKILERSDSGTTRKYKVARFQQYLKFFIMMGISWVMELVSFAVGGRDSLWFITDTFNTLRGFFAFYVYVICDEKNLLLLRKKLWSQTRNVSTSRSSLGSSSTSVPPRASLKFRQAYSRS